jgi:hypothetical protein
MTGKYLTAQELTNALSTFVLDPQFVPMTSDSYNEALIVEEINKMPDKEKVLSCVVTLATVGWGSKRFGQIKHRDKAIDISVVLAAGNVKLNLVKDTKLSERDLTPQRLCRAFREKIRTYLQESKFETYLYRKYSSKVVKFSDIMFRGSEYLEGLNKEQVDFILETYENMDAKLGTNISDRIIRVFKASGYITSVAK